MLTVQCDEWLWIKVCTKILKLRVYILQLPSCSIFHEALPSNICTLRKGKQRCEQMWQLLKFWGSGKPWSQVTRQRHYTEISALAVSLYGSDVATRVCVLCGNTRYTTVSILGLRVTEGWPDFSVPLLRFRQRGKKQSKWKEKERKKKWIRTEKSATLRHKDVSIVIGLPGDGRSTSQRKYTQIVFVHSMFWTGVTS